MKTKEYLKHRNAAFRYALEMSVDGFTIRDFKHLAIQYERFHQLDISTDVVFVKVVGGSTIAEGGHHFCTHDRVWNHLKTLVRRGVLHIEKRNGVNLYYFN